MTKCSSVAFLTKKRQPYAASRPTLNKFRPKRIGGLYRSLATYTEPIPEVEVTDEEYVPAPLPSGYTARHVLSIFPPKPVLDKLQEIQGRLAAKTRIVNVPRPSLQIVLLPLGTSLEDPVKLQVAKNVRSELFLELVSLMQ